MITGIFYGLILITWTVKLQVTGKLDFYTDLECENTFEKLLFCTDLSYKELDIDIVIEVMTTNKAFCDNIIKEPYSKQLEEQLPWTTVCAMRQRPDLVMKTYYSDFISIEDMGWIFPYGKTSACNMTTLTGMKSFFFTIYHCSNTTIESHKPQNEVAINENVTIELSDNEKFYITNTPAVVEAYQSRNPIWYRLRHDDSILTSAKQRYCEFNVKQNTTLLISGQGALFETFTSMQKQIYSDNAIMLFSSNDSVPIWTYRQNILKNKHSRLHFNSTESLVYKYMEDSEENKVVFAMPIEVISGHMNITCGLYTGFSHVILNNPTLSVSNIIDSSPLDKGQIAGIVIGVSLTVLIIVIFILLLLFCRHWQAKLEITSTTDHHETELESLNTSDVQHDIHSIVASSCGTIGGEPQGAHHKSKNCFSISGSVGSVSEVPLGPSALQHPKRTNNMQRKISYAKEDNLYYDLDDIVFNPDSGTMSGDAHMETVELKALTPTSHIPHRRSVAIMIDNNLYTVNGENIAKSEGYICRNVNTDQHDNFYVSDNTQCLDILDNVRTAKPCETNISSTGKVKKHKHNCKRHHKSSPPVKRISVAKMVNNDIYTSSSDDEIVHGIKLCSEDTKSIVSFSRQNSGIYTDETVLCSQEEQPQVKLPLKRKSSHNYNGSTSSDEESESGQKYSIEDPYEISIDNSSQKKAADNKSPNLSYLPMIPIASSHKGYEKSSHEQSIQLPIAASESGSSDENEACEQLNRCESEDSRKESDTEDNEDPYLISGKLVTPDSSHKNNIAQNNPNTSYSEPITSTFVNQNLPSTSVALPVRTNSISSYSDTSSSSDEESGECDCSSDSEDPYQRSVDTKDKTSSIHGRKDSPHHSNSDVSDGKTKSGFTERIQLPIISPTCPTSSECSNSSSDYDQCIEADTPTASNKTSDADNYNPYLKDIGKRPSVVQMVENEIYSSSSDVDNAVIKEKRNRFKIDYKRPSITIMVENEAHCPSSEDDRASVKKQTTNNDALNTKHGKVKHSKKNRMVITSDNYVHSGGNFLAGIKKKMYNRKKPKGQLHHQYEVIPEKVKKTGHHQVCNSSDEEDEKQTVVA